LRRFIQLESEASLNLFPDEEPALLRRRSDCGGLFRCREDGAAIV
jgi:hypothetical protein